MRRLLIRILLLLVVLAWLAGAGIVMFVRPDGPTDAPFDLRVPETPVSRFFGYDGYVCTSGVGFGPDGNDPRIETILVRQPLNRSAGTFPLSLRYSTNNKIPLREVRLAVSTTGRADLDDAEAWTWIARAKAERRGTQWVAVIEAAQAPASANTGSFRAQQILADGSTWSFAKTMPQAPTFLGRVHDTIGHWPLFNWLPALR